MGRDKVMFITVAIALSLIFCAANPVTISAADEESKLVVPQWMILGPIPTPLPAYSDEGKKKISAKDLLDFEDIDLGGLDPSLTKEIAMPDGKTYTWKKLEADSSGVRIYHSSNLVQTSYLASYIEAKRWMKLDLSARGSEIFKIFIDGKAVGEKKSPSKDDLKKTVEVEQGKHIVVVKTIFAPSDSMSEWNFTLSLSPAVGSMEDLSISTNPDRPLSLKHIINLPFPASINISGDGSLFAITMMQHPENAGKTERWIEIRNTKTGTLLASLRGIKGLSRVKWSPKGRKLSYVSSDKDKSSVNIFDLETGNTTTILKDIKNLSDYIWAPNGKFIVYSIRENPKEKNKDVKRLRGIRDRWSYGRSRSYLYIVSVPSGVKRRITAGKYSTNLFDISPDGRAVLVGRDYEDLEERPYGKTELVEINLDDSSVELLWEGHWLHDATYSPDGKKLLVLGGPSAFGEIGLNVPEGTIPNDYDGQAYIFDLKSKKARAISREFNPSIIRGVWSRSDKKIYFVAEDSSFVRLFKYSPSRKRFTLITTGFDVIGRESYISRKKPLAILTGSSANKPPKIYLVDLARGSSRALLELNADEYKLVKLGRIENWDFTSSSGRRIKGRVHYPPDFDPGKKYPCIVYYYGGTSPTSRSFGGRYPKNLWAAKGYVVYVLQPSGATGFGQEFSSLHVNDWGKRVSDEIIEGVKKFLEAHPFVDKERVGCIGASYGGFMTQLLITKTDIFAAAISHAGISLIPHYWGEGYWGYAYNAVSAANSFPWNRKDIYVDQSPLFHADKITTPLLLLHGTEDTNVPTGESDQMYIALKLLHKPVEYVQIKGQNHIITDFEKRVIWSKTILAWFDRWLKHQPEWWYALYPDSREESESESTKSHACEIPSELSALEATSITKPTGELILVGNITKEDILSYIPEWGAENMGYEPDDRVVSELSTLIPDDISITCVLGTWCSDSEREVPRFWQIMKRADIDIKRLKMLAVDRSQAAADEATPENLVEWSKKIREHFDIELVPTFIVCSGGKELGRIIESPNKSLEEDLLEILKKR